MYYESRIPAQHNEVTKQRTLSFDHFMLCIVRNELMQEERGERVKNEDGERHGAIVF